MKRAWLLCFVVLVLLSGCSANLYKRVEITDVPNDVREYLDSHQEEPGAVFTVDPETRFGYLQVSVGEENQLAQHLRFAKADYDERSKSLAVFVEQYTPEWGKPNTHINSADWLLVMRFKKFDLNMLTVTVEGPDGQTVYVIDWETD